jgi:hypothetical protein
LRLVTKSLSSDPSVAQTCFDQASIRSFPSDDDPHPGARDWRNGFQEIKQSLCWLMEARWDEHEEILSAHPEPLPKSRAILFGFHDSITESVFVDYIW